MQEDNIFQLVGETLVENYLAWFSSSVFAYGQVLFRLLLFLFYFVWQDEKILKPFGVWPIPFLKKKKKKKKNLTQCSRLNPLCFWETICLYKWISYLLSSLKLISYFWTIVLILVLYHIIELSNITIKYITKIIKI